MQNSKQRTTSNPEQKRAPHVNIAGDYSAQGIDIAPDAMSAADFETEADELGEMKDIAPKVPTRGLINPSADKNVNTDWPVDE